jgi:WD40 repeat protein
MQRLCFAAVTVLCWLVADCALAGQGTVKTDRQGDPLPAGAVARIGTLRFRVGADATALAYSPTGRYLAVGGASFVSENLLVVFDAATGQAVHRLSGHPRSVNTVAFSADGRLLAAGGGDDRVSVWNVATGQRLWLSKPGLGGNCVTFVCAGTTPATDEGAGIRLIDAVTGTPGPLLRGHQRRIVNIAATPDGKRLASCALDGTVRLWDAFSGRELAQFAVAEKDGVAVVFSRDGRRLACGTLAGAIYLYDVAAAQVRWQTPARTNPASALAFSPDGAELIAADEDLRVLEAASGKLRRRFALPHAMSSLALRPDSQTVAVIRPRDGEVRMFRFDTGQAVQRLAGHGKAVLDLAFSPDGKSVATVSEEERFRLWDAATGRPLKEFQGQAGSIAFAPDGRTLATSTTRALSLWDVTTARQFRKLPLQASVFGKNERIVFLAGEPPLVLCPDYNRLGVWNAATGQMLPHAFVAEVDGWGVQSAVGFAVAADSQSVAVNSTLLGSGPIVFWEPRTGRELGRTAFPGSIVALSPDGRRFVARSRERLVLVDTRTSKEIFELPDASSIAVAAFAPDGSMLATGSTDGVVRLWETASGRQRRTFTGHQQGVWCIQFSPDGTRLASGSDDGTVLIWDVYHR